MIDIEEQFEGVESLGISHVVSFNREGACQRLICYPAPVELELTASQKPLSLRCSWPDLQDSQAGKVSVSMPCFL